LIDAADGEFDAYVSLVETIVHGYFLVADYGPAMKEEAFVRRVV